MYYCLRVFLNKSGKPASSYIIWMQHTIVQLRYTQDLDWATSRYRSTFIHWTWAVSVRALMILRLIKSIVSFRLCMIWGAIKSMILRLFYSLPAHVICCIVALIPYWGILAYTVACYGVLLIISCLSAVFLKVNTQIYQRHYSNIQGKNSNTQTYPCIHAIRSISIQRHTSK